MLYPEQFQLFIWLMFEFQSNLQFWQNIFEHLRIKCPAQGSNRHSLVLAFELPTFYSWTQRLNHWATITGGHTFTLPASSRLLFFCWFFLPTSDTDLLLLHACKQLRLDLFIFFWSNVGYLKKTKKKHMVIWFTFKRQFSCSWHMSMQIENLQVLNFHTGGNKTATRLQAHFLEHCRA